MQYHCSIFIYQIFNNMLECVAFLMKYVVLLVSTYVFSAKGASVQRLRQRRPNGSPSPAATYIY